MSPSINDGHYTDFGTQTNQFEVEDEDLLSMEPAPLTVEKVKTAVSPAKPRV